MAAITAAAIMAGSALAGGAMAANASKNAAKTQAQSAERAQQVNADMFRQQQQMQQPYMNLGNGAASMLGRLMGSPAGARFATPAPQNPMNGWGVMQGGMGQMGQMAAQRRPGIPAGRSGVGPMPPQAGQNPWAMFGGGQ